MKHGEIAIVSVIALGTIGLIYFVDDFPAIPTFDAQVEQTTQPAAKSSPDAENAYANYETWGVNPDNTRDLSEILGTLEYISSLSDIERERLLEQALETAEENPTEQTQSEDRTTTREVVNNRGGIVFRNYYRGGGGRSRNPYEDLPPRDQFDKEELKASLDSVLLPQIRETFAKNETLLKTDYQQFYHYSRRMAYIAYHPYLQDVSDYQPKWLSDIAASMSVYGSYARRVEFAQAADDRAMAAKWREAMTKNSKSVRNFVNTPQYIEKEEEEKSPFREPQFREPEFREGI